MSQPHPFHSATRPLPPRPRLVLRAGFAGRKDLTPDERTRLETSLEEVFRTLGYRLAAIIPGLPVAVGQEPREQKKGTPNLVG